MLGFWEDANYACTEMGNPLIDQHVGWLPGFSFLFFFPLKHSSLVFHSLSVVAFLNYDAMP